MLSQSEIDALLSGSIEIEGSNSEGSVNLAELMDQPTTATKPKEVDPSKQVRPYNFWSPEHFSKDQMRSVELIHEDLAERLTSSLPTFVRTNLRPRVVHTEQGRCHDFLKDAPADSLFHMISLAPLPGNMMITISPEISYVILEQRLGGQSSGGSKSRHLTEIDQFLLRGLIEHMLNDIKASWSKVVAIEPSLEDSTINQHWVQMVMGNERMMLITMEMTLQGITGAMNIYIPFNLLKPIASILKPHIFFSGRKERLTDIASRNYVANKLTDVNLPVRVFLGSTKVSLGFIANLKPGDVISLDVSPNSDVPVQISNRICYTAKVGKIGNRFAAQISQEVHSTQDFLP